MTAIKANSDLLIWSTQGNLDSREGIYSYSIANNFWEPTVVPLPSSYNDWYKLKAAADPQTNDVYLPSGKGQGRSMAVYKTASSVGEELPMPPPETLIADVFGYTTLWSTFRNSMLLYGGLSYNVSRVFNPSLVEFIPGNKTWARIPTTGMSPGEVNAHCMVPVYNGTKIVVFGGYGPSGAHGNIYILDLQSMVWSKGVSGDPRAEMACSARGDNFIAWGGELEGAVIRNTFNTPIIYNLRTNVWTTEYISTSTSPPSFESNSPSKVNVSAIAGGAGAAVVLVVVVAVFVYRRHRFKSNTKPSESHIQVDEKDIQTTSEGAHVQADTIVPNTPTQQDSPRTNLQYPYSPATTLVYGSSPHTVAGSHYTPNMVATPYFKPFTAEYHSPSAPVYQHPSPTPAQYFYSPTMSFSGSPHSPTTTIRAYHFLPTLTSGYQLPAPVPASHQTPHSSEAYHDLARYSDNVKVQLFADIGIDEPSAPLQALPTWPPLPPHSQTSLQISPDHPSLLKLSSNPHYHSPSAPLESTEQPSSIADKDEELREQIEAIKAQQELQYQTQQHNLERLRQEQTDQLELLRRQLKPGS
ncbi:hypothetical protein BGZ67_004133 [Mortierella alpina]|nr:hypothetical protein BGZ67_004133 [Mortierella alpina]